MTVSGVVVLYQQIFINVTINTFCLVVIVCLIRMKMRDGFFIYRILSRCRVGS